jgi:hypothetical protein
MKLIYFTAFGNLHAKMTKIAISSLLKTNQNYHIKLFTDDPEYFNDLKVETIYWKNKTKNDGYCIRAIVLDVFEKYEGIFYFDSDIFFKEWPKEFDELKQ